MMPHRTPLKRQLLSPPVWKDQLRQRCLQRLKKNRSQLLAKLRRPDASVSEEMQKLVHEQRQASLSSASVDDLLQLGRLNEGDYLEIVHSLEDALRQETEEDEALAEHMTELEDQELEAMLAGMDLTDTSQTEDYGEMQGQDVWVLCPICKAGYLREHATSTPFISCGCGFTFHAQFVYHGVLEDFQDKIVHAFLTHRDSCSSDPTFHKETQDGTDVLFISCTDCGCEHALP